jgi:LmeA-like phospholipid-binding
MSSDQTRPMPQWWEQPKGPGPQDSPEPEEPPASQRGPGQSYQGAQETQRLPRDQGSQETQFYQSGQQYQPQQPQPSAYQQSPGYQPPAQDYQPPAPGYQAPGYQPPQSYQGYQGPQGSRRAARRRRRKWPWITLIVIVLLLVAADRGIKAYAEDQMASQFQNSVGLSGKPTVNIEGFPFLTQLASQKFNKVDISATNETITAKSAGGGLLKVASLKATLQGMHIHGANSATIDDFNASALITFSALGDIGGIPQGVTLAPDGPNRLKATLNVDPLGEFTAHATVTRVGQDKIHIHITDFGGIPDDGLFGNLADFTVTLPKLPAGVTIQSISITQQGLRIVATGHNTTLTQ